MFVDLKTISEEPSVYKISFDLEMLKDGIEDGRIIDTVENIEVEAGLSRIEDRFLIEGNFAGTLIMQCDRCGGFFNFNLSSEFSSYMAQAAGEHGESEIELLEEDMMLDFITGDIVELNDIVRGHIFLSLPFSSLCKLDCRGLCPICGTNLNVEECRCPKKETITAFSKLKNLKLEGE